MNGKIVRRCKVCGAEYETCYSCEKNSSWRMHTDTADHYYILYVLMDYQGGQDAKTSYRALRKRGVDFANTNEYLPEVRKLLDEIYAGSHNGKTLFVKEAEPAQAPEVAAEQPQEEAGSAEETYTVGSL